MEKQTQVQATPQSQIVESIPGFKQAFKFLQWNVNRGVEGEKNGEKFPMYTWKNREERIVSLIKEVDADIVCLQELRELPGTTPVWKFLSRFQEIGYDYDAQAPNPGAMAFSQVTMWKKSKFFKIESKAIWLSETPETVSDSWNKFRVFGHTCFGVKLLTVDSTGNKIISEAEPLWVFNTHFSIEEHFKTMASKHIKSMMDKATGNKGRYILSGDFNFFPKNEKGDFFGDEQRKEIATHLTDCAKDAKSLGGKLLKGTFVGIESDPFKAPLPDLNTSRLDHVFATGEYTVDSAVLYTKTMKVPEPSELSDREFPSDHLPLVVNFSEK